jgi:hypothetical protein
MWRKMLGTIWYYNTFHFEDFHKLVPHMHVREVDAKEVRIDEGHDRHFWDRGSDEKQCVYHDCRYESVVARSLRRYLSLLFSEMALSVTCNRLHSLEQRCARWLLTAMDKSDTSEMPVTQEMLAGILGVYRQSIVQVLSAFETAGVVLCSRGSIRMEARDRLVAIACECYQAGRKGTWGR